MSETSISWSVFAVAVAVAMSLIILSAFNTLQVLTETDYQTLSNSLFDDLAIRKHQ